MVKRKKPTSPPRRSTRLRREPSTLDTQPSGLSVISTDTEPTENRPTLEHRALQRIDDYQFKDRLDEGILKKTFTAFIDNLPPKGCDSLVRDIIAATTDDQLYEVFRNLVTALVLPSKSRLLLLYNEPGKLIF